MPTKTNPYVNPNKERQSRGEAPGPIFGLFPHIGRYAVPDIPETTDPEYTTGYATQLDPVYGSGTTPDLIRTGQVEPPENDPNDREYNAHRYSEFLRRHSVEEVTQNWHVKQQKVAPGQNPLWEQERMPIRSTATDAPMPYMFRRPWHIPRQIQDAVSEESITHLSLADHRRAYEIMGMAPQGKIGANTYRLDPRPWDEQLFYPVQSGSGSDEGVGAGVNGGNRSYRL